MIVTAFIDKSFLDWDEQSPLFVTPTVLAQGKEDTLISNVQTIWKLKCFLCYAYTARAFSKDKCDCL